MSVNIISMLTESLYTPNPNSVLSNFIIAMGHTSENSESLRSLLSFTSIQNIFDLDIPIQLHAILKLLQSSLEFNKHLANTLVHSVSGVRIRNARNNLSS